MTFKLLLALLILILLVGCSEEKKGCELLILNETSDVINVIELDFQGCNELKTSCVFIDGCQYTSEGNFAIKMIESNETEEQ